MTDNSENSAPHLEACKLIKIILPDDGTDRRLIKTLRHDRGITRVDTVPVRAVAALQEAKTKRGRLPESTLARLVTVVVKENEASNLFDYIYQMAAINRPGGGMMFLEQLIGATPFLLPEGVPDEND